MIYQLSVLIFLFICVRPNESNLKRDMVDVKLNDNTFAFWPSFHNGVTSMKIRKREATQPIPNEGGGTVEPIKQNSLQLSTSVSKPQVDPLRDTQITVLNSSAPRDVVNNVTQATDNTISNSTSTISSSLNSTATISMLSNSADTNSSSSNSTAKNSTSSNRTATKSTALDAKSFDLKDPGVLKRTLIVFGGFTLLAVAYYVFYRRKNNKKDNNSGHGLGDTNQFRYGILQSEDTRDKMELSRIPLTMESDDEEDEDLEIFDLEQKKKSLSYVNLQINDEEIVNLSNNSKDDADTILLDIDDRGTDTLINWSNNGSKSIL